jgi:ribosomal-protein-alanine N-acetyltransferase
MTTDAAVRVEDATVDDAAAIARLEESCLGRDAWSACLVSEGLAHRLPTIGYVVARSEDGVLGHAVASYAGDIAELQRIAVDPAARRRGVASALLDEVVLRARRSAADRLLLEVREDNAGALAFYAARGFTEVDRRPRYYRDGATAVVLRLPLGRGCGGKS